MRDPEILVRFRPSGREAYCLPGTRVMEAAAEAGIVLNAPCGGEGICGKCRVLIAEGAAESTGAEKNCFSAEELRAGWRLACQTTVVGPAEIQVPRETQAVAGHQILVDSANGTTSTDDPPVRKRFLEMPPPRRGDDLPDLLRLERALDSGPLHADIGLLRELPERLRQLQFRGTAVLSDGQLLDVEAENTESDAFAVAFDIGTTTLAGVLLDLGTGTEWAVDARLNPQTRFGDDVLSRILHARQQSGGLRQLQEAVVGMVNEMIEELCRRAGIPSHRIYEAAIAGNTTMQQLLCGVSPNALAEVPFAPAGGRGLQCRAADLGIRIHPRAAGYVMPVIGGFVGGDTVAGILATQMTESDGPSLLVDIGTNGEIVLWANGRLWAASTAAGPAFEGARISRGMRGCAGAIEKIVVDDRLRCNVIGNIPPAGLCGSGLIDAAAELLRHQVLTSRGQLRMPGELPAEVLPDLARRVQTSDGQAAFLLAAEAETADGRPIFLTQRDLRELQLAAGAIRAGIAILLRRAGVDPGHLNTVLIGGGFGNFIRRSNAQRLGLLPGEIERRRIRFMGNTALAGARLAALSRKARDHAETLARRAEHVDLSMDAAFHQAFAEAMIFPEV